MIRLQSGVGTPAVFASTLPHTHGIGISAGLRWLILAAARPPARLLPSSSPEDPRRPPRIRGAGAPPVIVVPGPYNVSFQRANGAKPFISSHFPVGQHGHSAFFFNLVPAYVRLPGGQDALVVRSVNGTSWATGTTSTTLNPDKLTLTTFTTMDGAADMGSVDVRPIGADSVLLEPTGPSEACGVQDPRISHNPADGTYYMTYCVYGPPLPKDPKTNPLGIKCGGAGVGLATSKTPGNKTSWVRHGGCGRTGTSHFRVRPTACELQGRGRNRRTTGTQ